MCSLWTEGEQSVAAVETLSRDFRDCLSSPGTGTLVIQWNINTAGSMMNGTSLTNDASSDRMSSAEGMEREHPGADLFLFLSLSPPMTSRLKQDDRNSSWSLLRFSRSLCLSPSHESQPQRKRLVGSWENNVWTCVFRRVVAEPMTTFTTGCK